MVVAISASCNLVETGKMFQKMKGIRPSSRKIPLSIYKGEGRVRVDVFSPKQIQSESDGGKTF